MWLHGEQPSGHRVGPPIQTEGFLFSASTIDSVTVQAYRETEYRVFAEPVFTLRVGQASAELLAAHKFRRTDCSAFLTACKPYSQAFDAASNAQRQVGLAKELKQRSLALEPGIGQHRLDVDETPFVLDPETATQILAYGLSCRRQPHLLCHSLARWGNRFADNKREQRYDRRNLKKPKQQVLRRHSR